MKKTANGVQLVTDVTKTTVKVELPKETNQNTLGYMLNAIKKQLPQAGGAAGQTVAKDANVSKAEDAKKKREEE